MSLALLTLPRTALRGTGFVPDGCHVALLTPTEPERRRAARALRDAIVAGSIAPAVVARAVAAGDAGVAALFQAHRVTPPRASMAPRALDMRALDAAPAAPVRMGLARLIETLFADGDLARAALAQIPNLSPRDLAVCLNSAWANRVKRVTRGLRRLLPQGCEASSTHFVYPAALLSLINPYTLHAESEHSDDASQVDVVIGLVRDADLRLGGESDTPEDVRALRVAWDEVVNALETDALAPWQSSEEPSYLAFLLESLNDLALTCEWDGDDPRVSHEQLAAVLEEMGEDPDDEALHERARDYMRELRAERKKPMWTRRSKAFNAWRAARKGTPAGVRVEGLLALAQWRQRLALKERLCVDNDEDEGVFAITPVHRAAAFGNLLANFIQEEQQQVGDATRRVGREPGSGLSLGQVLDALIADAAVAGAACSLFQETEAVPTCVEPRCGDSW